MSIKRILVLGAYGNFGRHIIAGLAGEKDMQLIIAGRCQQKCEALLASYRDVPNPPLVEVFDIHHKLIEKLKTIKPDIVVNTCGPFQAQDYFVSEACIEYGCHYVDLADGREFVCNIRQLNQKAQQKKVSIISGASSVPCLTAAVVDHYLKEFSVLEAVDGGIATSQRINVGLATTRGTFSYAGKPIEMLKEAKQQKVYGWQGIKRRVYPILGSRYLSYCDIPDLQLFPERYPDLKTYEFRAGLEVPFVHWTLWGLSWLARAKLIRNLPSWAPMLRKISFLFNPLGSNNSGFHVEMRGKDLHGKDKTSTFYLIALDRYGPYIPSMPAILCAKKLARGEIDKCGAYPCLDIITLNEYLDALDGDKIKVIKK